MKVYKATYTNLTGVFCLLERETQHNIQACPHHLSPINENFFNELEKCPNYIRKVDEGELLEVHYNLDGDSYVTLQRDNVSGYFASVAIKELKKEEK